MFKRLKKFFTDPVFSKKKAFLKSLSLFQDLGDRDLGRVLQALHSRTYQEGETLFEEGDIGRALFILESGRVEIRQRDSRGQTQRLLVLEPGDFFGEMALLEHLPRSGSAVALERSQAHLLYRSRLEGLLHYHPRIGVSIMRHLAQLLSARLRRTTRSLVSGEPAKVSTGTAKVSRGTAEVS